MSESTPTVRDAPDDVSLEPTAPLRRRGGSGYSYCRLVAWDWAREMKQKETVLSMVLFALVTLMIFAMATPAVVSDGSAGAVDTVEKVGAGILWAIFFLAGSIGVDRAFRGTAGGRVFEGLLLAPIGRVTLFYAKVTSTLLYMLLMEGIVATLFCLLYGVNLSFATAGHLALTIIGGSVGFVVTGITLSSMTRSLRGGEVLLRILLFPLLIPLFSALVSLTEIVFNAERWQALNMGGKSSTTEWLAIIAFDLVFMAAGQVLFGVVVSDFDG